MKQLNANSNKIIRYLKNKNTAQQLRKISDDFNNNTLGFAKNIQNKQKLDIKKLPEKMKIFSKFIDSKLMFF